ncbi:Proteophosphoglycan ppg4 [Rhodotorula toruloides]|nr:Proteophosphoglycan ppg4 [Rhodotorula toruloides]
MREVDIIEDERSSKRLAGLAAHDEAAANVKEFYGELWAFLPDLQCFVLSKLKNLTHLSISFGDADGMSPLPDCFFDALRSLRHLSSLDIQHDERDVPKDGFSFERDVPSLRRLSIVAKGPLSAYAPGLANITHLSIGGPTYVEHAIPWQTLLSLSISGPPDCRLLLASLAANAQSSEIPLRSLVFFKSCLRSPEGSNSLSLVEVTEALRATRLADFTIVNLQASDIWNLYAQGATLPSVERLTLYGTGRCECVLQGHLESLRALVTLFPALQKLRLERIQLYRDSDLFEHTATWTSSEQTKAAILRSAEQGDLASSFPAVDTLLGFLRLTTVLDFSFDVTNGAGIRWRRFSRDEDFIAEGWSEI